MDPSSKDGRWEFSTTRKPQSRRRWFHSPPSQVKTAREGWGGEGGGGHCPLFAGEIRGRFYCTRRKTADSEDSSIHYVDPPRASLVTVFLASTKNTRPIFLARSTILPEYISSIRYSTSPLLRSARDCRQTHLRILSPVKDASD